MKRAAVWKGASGRWWVDVVRVEDWDLTVGIAEQEWSVLTNPRHPGHATHAEALTAAITAVGLDTHPAHREAP